MDTALAWPRWWPQFNVGSQWVSVDDGTLVERARRGDDQAFTALFEEFHGPILNYIYRMVNDRAVAEDLTQDTFVKAYRALPKAERDLAFKPWLYRIATNTAISHLRRGKVIRWLPFVSEPERRGERLDASISRKTDIEAVLGQLPQHYATILLLRHYQGLSLAETAASLDITENAAKLRLFRARKAFARIYGELPDGAPDPEVLS